MTVTIRDLAEVWGVRMAAGGFDDARAGLRSGWESGKALTWRQLAGTHLEVVQPKRPPKAAAPAK